MSLAIYAAPFNGNSNNNEADNIVEKKKLTHNKTQKRYSDTDVNTDRVNSVLSNIHDSAPDDQDQAILGDFKPPPPPESAGVNRSIDRKVESMQSMKNEFRALVGKAPEPNNENRNEFDMNNYTTNYGDEKSNDEYYNKMLPGYKNSPSPYKNPANKQYYAGQQQSFSNPSEDVVMQKLNYMINLLEEQQDTKTNSVTEEVVLYSFLGIFIIFVVDSFARAGKYVR
jgi:hypothetical protein